MTASFPDSIVDSDQDTSPEVVKVSMKSSDWISDVPQEYETEDQLKSTQIAQSVDFTGGIYSIPPKLVPY